MTRRCPRCGRRYEQALKHYCSRCHVELVAAADEPPEEELRAPPVARPPRELSMRERVEVALFALLLLLVGALDLVSLAGDAAVPRWLLLGANALAVAPGVGLYLRERRRRAAAVDSSAGNGGPQRVERPERR